MGRNKKITRIHQKHRQKKQKQNINRSAGDSNQQLGPKPVP